MATKKQIAEEAKVALKKKVAKKKTEPKTDVLYKELKDGLACLGKRIDRIVEAINKSKSVKGL